MTNCYYCGDPVNVTIVAHFDWDPDTGESADHPMCIYCIVKHGLNHIPSENQIQGEVHDPM